MSFWSKEIRPRNTTEATRELIVPEKVFVENDGPTRETFPDSDKYLNRFYDVLNGYYAPQNYIELFYQLPEIFAPIHEIASRVSDANWQLLRESTDRAIYTDEAFNRLFSTPNPLSSFKNFVYTSVCYEILTGKQFWYINLPDTLPQEYKYIQGWWNLPAHQVIEETKQVDVYSITQIEDIITRYKIPQYTLNGVNNYRYFDPKKVIASVNYSLTADYKIIGAKPIIAGAEKAIRNLIPVYEARGNIYIKRGALGAWVNKGRDTNGPFLLTEEQKKELAKIHLANHGLTGDKSPMAFTDADVDFIRTGMSIKELEPFDETVQDAVAIYATLRVPRHLVPTKDNSTFSNADADMRSFYENTIIPWAKKYAQLWTSRMGFAQDKKYISPDYSHIGILQDDVTKKSQAERLEGQTWLERWQNGVCSLNEWITAFDGTPGTGAVYEKKKLELTPEEAKQVMEILNPQVNNNENENNNESENTRTQKQS